jgi:hypothetical protein
MEPGLNRPPNTFSPFSSPTTVACKTGFTFLCPAGILAITFAYTLVFALPNGIKCKT